MPTASPASQQSRSGTRARTPPAAAAVPLVLATLVSGAWLSIPAARSAGRGPAIVLLVPGPAGAPEKQAVLAPPDVLEELEAAARRGTAALRGAALTGARYAGEV